MAKGTDTRADGSKASGSKASAPKATDPNASAGNGGDSATNGTKPRASGSKAAAAKAVATSAAKPSPTKPSPAKPSRAKQRSPKAKAGAAKAKGSNAADAKRAARIEKKIASYDRKESKLAKQLDKLHDRQGAARIRLSALAVGRTAAAGKTASAKPSTDGTGAERTAFCLREKRRVTVIEAHPTVLRNGRAAIAGVCASCGAKLVTLVAAPR